MWSVTTQRRASAFHPAPTVDPIAHWNAIAHGKWSKILRSEIFIRRAGPNTGLASWSAHLLDLGQLALVIDFLPRRSQQVTADDKTVGLHSFPGVRVVRGRTHRLGHRRELDLFVRIR